MQRISMHSIPPLTKKQPVYKAVYSNERENLHTHIRKKLNILAKKSLEFL